MTNAKQCPKCHTLIMEITDEMVETILVTAMEGGIGYWLEEYDNSDVRYWDFDEQQREDKRPTFVEKGSMRMKPEDGLYRTLHKHRLIEGIRKAACHMGQSVEAFYEDHDANGADVAVQFALFDEVVYG